MMSPSSRTHALLTDRPVRSQSARNEPRRPSWQGCGWAHFSYFWMVRSSTPPVRYRIWPPVVDLPASTCPMKTIFRCSLRGPGGCPGAGMRRHVCCTQPQPTQEKQRTHVLWGEQVHTEPHQAASSATVQRTEQQAQVRSLAEGTRDSTPTHQGERARCRNCRTLLPLCSAAERSTAPTRSRARRRSLQQRAAPPPGAAQLPAPGPARLSSAFASSSSIRRSSSTRAALSPSSSSSSSPSSGIGSDTGSFRAGAAAGAAAGASGAAAPFPGAGGCGAGAAVPSAGGGFARAGSASVMCTSAVSAAGLSTPAR